MHNGWQHSAGMCMLCCRHCGNTAGHCGNTKGHCGNTTGLRMDLHVGACAAISGTCTRPSIPIVGFICIRGLISSPTPTNRIVTGQFLHWINSWPQRTGQEHDSIALLWTQCVGRGAVGRKCCRGWVRFVRSEASPGLHTRNCVASAGGGVRITCCRAGSSIKPTLHVYWEDIVLPSMSSRTFLTAARRNPSQLALGAIVVDIISGDSSWWDATQTLQRTWGRGCARIGSMQWTWGNYGSTHGHGQQMRFCSLPLLQQQTIRMRPRHRCPTTANQLLQRGTVPLTQLNGIRCHPQCIYDRQSTASHWKPEVTAT
eukprot:m.653708 g.653708  ORF g.653708 m.653708 type:complete len:314 (+) comp22691_c2_seq48:1608-2549(+)